MFSYKLLKDHAGLLLIGDADSLVHLNEIMHDVCDRSPFLNGELPGGESFLALAYDARKAYEGKREIIPLLHDQPEYGNQYGVEIPWPALLAQARMLRVSLGYIDHSKWHQAITYALEAVLEDGLEEDFGPDAQAVLDRLRSFDSEVTEILGRLDDICECYASWNAGQRKQHLITLLVPPTLREIFGMTTPPSRFE